MGLYKSSKLGFDFLLRTNRNQIQNPIGIGHHHRSIHTRPSFSQSNHHLSRRPPPPILQFCRNKLKISPFLFGSSKNYSSKFVPKEVRGGALEQLKFSLKQLKKIRVRLKNVQPEVDKKFWRKHLIMFGLFVIVDGLYMFLETIPYTNRRHFVFISHDREKVLGETGSKDMKENDVKGKIMPEDDPQSVRVRLIAKNILNAVESGLGDRIIVQSKDGSEVEKMKKKGKKEKKNGGSIEHMEVFDWEFLVVEDSCYFQSGSLPGGKIYICTGDLSLCESDAEIASILAREIGHAMARHVAEKLSMKSFYLASWVKSTEKLMNDWFLHPSLRKFEFEADYIGLLLMASAGYDPRVTLSFWKKLMEKHVATVVSSHPTIEERLEKLSRPEVMEEALSLYQEQESINSNGLPENQSQK